MSDLINKIRNAQIDAGERAVLEHLGVKDQFDLPPVDGAALELKTGQLDANQILAIDEMETELIKATAAWPPFNSAHEGFAVLKEEIDELWEFVRQKQKNRVLPEMRKEAIQVAAMAIRFAAECCDEGTGRK